MKFSNEVFISDKLSVITITKIKQQLLMLCEIYNTKPSLASLAIVLDKSHEKVHQSNVIKEDDFIIT